MCSQPALTPILFASCRRHLLPPLSPAVFTGERGLGYLLWSLLHFPRKPHTFQGFRSVQHTKAAALSILPAPYHRCLEQQVQPGPGVPKHLLSLLSLLCHGKTSPSKRAEEGCSQQLATPQNMLVHKTCPAPHVPQLFACRQHAAGSSCLLWVGWEEDPTGEKNKIRIRA